MTLQDIQNQLSALFGGGNQNQSQQLQGTSTYPTAYNTGPEWSPNNVAGAASDSGFGFNLGTAGAALGGLNALGGLIQGNKALKLGQDQFKFQKNLANTNLNNSIKSYNTALEDRLTARGAQQNDDSLTTQERIDKNRLSR